MKLQVYHHRRVCGKVLVYNSFLSCFAQLKKKPIFRLYFRLIDTEFLISRGKGHILKCLIETPCYLFKKGNGHTFAELLTSVCCRVDDAMVKIKDKMLYTSSKKQLQSKMEGIAVNLQCNSIEDLEWAAIVSKCASKYD